MQLIERNHVPYRLTLSTRCLMRLPSFCGESLHRNLKTVAKPLILPPNSNASRHSVLHLIWRGFNRKCLLLCAEPSPVGVNPFSMISYSPLQSIHSFFEFLLIILRKSRKTYKSQTQVIDRDAWSKLSYEVRFLSILSPL